METNSNYSLLIQKLDAFTRKFYLNKLVRGALFFGAVVISIYLVFSFLEYNFYFSTDVRKILFYSFIAGSVVFISLWILTPLFKYFKLGKQIDHATAAKIIGAHFSQVEDKLLNILQLKETENSVASKELIEASINQKIETIKPVPFSLAINLNKNKKYLKYTLPPLAVLIFILFASPDILRDSNYRLLRNNTFFEKQAPFQFNISNKTLEVIQYNDYELNIKITGEALPDNVMVETSTGSYNMIKNSADEFSFTFNKVPSNTEFNLIANGFNSKEYTLEVIPKPAIINFDVRLNYPDYTRKKDEILKNAGDMIIPEGTDVSWIFNTENTELIDLIFPAEKTKATRDGKNNFSFSKKIFNNQLYKISIANNRIISNDTIQYSIDVIPDAYPQINVQQFADSTDDKFLFFAGEINDDYGFKNLQFHYLLEGTDVKGNTFTKKEGDEKISFINTSLKNPFNYAFDLHQYSLQPGDRVTYFFEVWDNDGVHGSKSTRSSALQYIVPTKEELEEIREESNEEIKNSLEDVLSELDAIKKETEEMQDKLLEKKELNWDDKKKLENLLQRQNNAQQQIEDLKKEFEKNLSMQKEYMEPNPEILEKQEQLQEMFEEVLTDEMKKLYEEIQKLLEELTKEQSLEQMQEMNMNNEQLEKELDRMLELFKQLEMEQKMQETVDKLNELAKEQENASEQTENKQSEKEQNIENQEDISKKFDEIQEDIDKLEEMNKELEDQKDLENTEQSEQQVEEEQQKASEQLQQSQKKQASQSQKNASQKMKEMAQNMQNQMQQMQMQQQQEDMNALRQLLDNLIKLSVDQESLMDELKNTKTNNPKYVDLMANQQKIKEDNKIVEDSLYALAKRVFQISSTITREMESVNNNIDKSLSQLSERSINQANMYQQLTMTSYNNLALLLDEVMQQMQQQMAQSMPGSQMCQKPGGESQLPSMGEMQKQLNEQLKKMKGEMENGQQKGSKEGMSKELAEMAAKQAAIRDALQQMAKELGGGNTEDGKLAKQLQQIAEKMDQTEEDIVNKLLSDEMLKRQQDILTRLLEAADSERERKTDNERQSNTAKEVNRELPPAIEEYIKKRNSEIDLFKTMSPELKPFYKNLVEEYFRSISK
ncbi:MAG: DUF4175 domain-containing protein [Fimbriimonadaceae bacterium]|nr:DUF4175 domain-containing protein [Chitinophagales bacterium]